MRIQKLKIKSIKKAVKIGGRLIGSFLLLIILLLLFLRSSTVQTYLTQRIASYFSDRLETTVSLSKVDIDFFKTLVLEDFLIKDLSGDTLFYSGRLGLDLKLIQPNEKSLVVNQITLENTLFNLTTWDDRKGSNYDFIVDYFSPTETVIDTNQVAWKLNFDRVELINAHFIYNNDGHQEANYGIDFSHIDARAVYGTFEELEILNDTIFSTVSGLRFKEKSGFELQNLSGLAKVHGTVTQLMGLHIETPLSNVKADLTFDMESFSSYSKFIEEVEMDVDFKQTVAAFEDIAYFASDLKDLKEKVFLEGKVSGTVANMKGRNVTMQLLSNTFLKGDFDLRGLPVIDETFIYLKLKSLETNKSSLEQLPLYPFSEGKQLQLPSQFTKLGDLKFHGSFTGFITDFVAYGELSTAVGSIVTDVAFKNQDEIPSYTGNVSLNRFDIGRLFDISKTVRKTTLKTTISGKGITLESLDIKLDGFVKNIDFIGYNYQNIALEGTLKNQLFDGIAAIKDENIDFDFNGKIDLASKLPIYNFTANINKANLANLKLVNSSDSNLVISTTAELNMIGDELDNLDGSILLKNSFFRDSVNAFFVKNIELNAIRFNDSTRSIALRSDLVDLNMNGNFIFKDLVPSVTNFAIAYIPSARKELINHLSTEDFTFDITLKNTSILSILFFPTVNIGGQSRINGNYNSKKQDLNLYGSFPYLKVDGYQFHNITLQGESPDGALTLDATINQLAISDSSNIENIQFQLVSSNDSVTTFINWLNQSEKGYAANLQLQTTFNGFTKSEHRFVNSSIVINDRTWKFLEGNHLKVDSSAITVKQLNIKSTLEELAIAGKISNHSEDTVSIAFKEMSLSYLQHVIPPSAVQLEGAVSGNITLKDLYHKAIITAKMNMHDFVINQNRIGDGILKSTYDIDNEELFSVGSFGPSNQPYLNVSGSYFPTKKSDNVKLNATFNQAPLNIFEQYCIDYLSHVKGTFNGSIMVGGDISLPELKGRLQLKDASFMVDYLNTSYTINDEVIIEPDFFGFNLIKIVDEKGNPAIATGTAFHENYEKFSLDIGLELNNFLALNTSVTDNDLYYGRVNVSGLANISGYANNLIFDMNVSTEKNTRINIPLTEGTEVYSSNFLTFVEKNAVYKQPLDYIVDLDGIDMNFDLTVTPDAEVRLIFDEQIGDVIKGKGNGNIKMEITSLGDFEIFGNYTIQEGDYLFTLQNLINKKFVLQKGGQITWNGDPFKANMDLSADYKLRSSLYDILPDDSLGRYRRRVPVNLGLNMRGELMNPDISFDINLPTADDETKQRLQSILYVNSAEVNKQEMNKQVFSLLILNRFAPVSGLNQQYEHANVGATSSSEFLSNQLSNWLSRLSDDVNIGVNYRPGDELSSDEYEVALSTQFFNDRVILDGNVGYSSNNYQYENTQSTSGLIGEFSVEYKISKDGRFRLRGFNRSNNNSLLQINSPYTQGAGLFYREEFDSFSELIEKYKRVIFTRKGDADQ